MSLLNLGEAGVGARRSLSPEGWGEDGDCRRRGKAGPGRKPLLSVVVVVAGVIDVGPYSSSSKTLPVRSHRCGQVSRTSAACGQCYVQPSISLTRLSITRSSRLLSLNILVDVGMQ